MRQTICLVSYWKTFHPCLFYIVPWQVVTKGHWSPVGMMGKSWCPQHHNSVSFPSMSTVSTSLSRCAGCALVLHSVPVFSFFVSPLHSSYLPAAQPVSVMLSSTDGKGELAHVKSKYSKSCFCEVEKLKLGACKSSVSFTCEEKNPKFPTPVMSLTWKISLNRSWF